MVTRPRENIEYYRCAKEEEEEEQKEKNKFRPKSEREVVEAGRGHG